MTSGIEQLKQRTGIAPAANAPKTLQAMIASLVPRLQKVAAKHMNADRLLNIALNMQKDPNVAACSPASLLGCVMMSAITGLEPGVFGQCYYVPFKGQLTFIPGWQGYADLVARTGRGEAWTGAVYDGDEFSYKLGSRPSLDHTPSEDLTEVDEKGGRKLLYCYAVGFSKGSERPIIEVWPKKKVQAHLNRYNKVGDRHYALTNLHNFEMYGRKIAFLQVVKYLPKSAEIQQVASLDFAADAGTQALTPDSVLDGAQPELPSETYTQTKSDSSSSSAEMQREPSAEESKLAQLFELLSWNLDTQAKWLKANQSLSMSEKIAKLEPELDR